MSHPTSFTLDWTAEDGFPDDHLDEEVAGYIAAHSQMSFALEEDGSCANDCSWGSFNQDLCEMSLRFPDVQFHLYGEGREDLEDIFDAWYLNGKGQVHQAEVEVTRQEEPDPEAWE